MLKVEIGKNRMIIDWYLLKLVPVRVVVVLCVFLLLIFHATHVLKAGNPDSLKVQLRQKSLPDSTRLRVLIKLAKEYDWSWPDSALKFVTP